MFQLGVLLSQLEHRIVAGIDVECEPNPWCLFAGDTNSRCQASAMITPCAIAGNQRRRIADAGQLSAGDELVIPDPPRLAAAARR